MLPTHIKSKKLNIDLNMGFYGVSVSTTLRSETISLLDCGFYSLRKGSFVAKTKC